MGERTRRLYRKRGRFYADFRDFSDVGGSQEAMVPDGERCATKDARVAEVLMARRLVELHELRTGRRLDGPLLQEYLEHHLDVKSGYRAASTIARDRQSFDNLLAYFGDDVRLTEIGVRELTDYVSWRRQQPGRDPGETISAQTVLHELHALSNLYKRAVAEGHVDVNPVRQLPEKPTVRREEASWLEPGEAFRLLEAAAAHDATAHPNAISFLRPLVATYLLTGGRKREVLGLLARDVDLRREIVHFRPNRYRTLKTRRSRRHVPLWPQLAEILDTYLARRAREPEELLFPSPATGEMLTSFRKSLATAVETAGIAKDVTPHTFRHTYTAQRIQTLDGGAPVTLYQVARELGHKTVSLIQDRYGHLQEGRYRAEVVEYREGRVVGEIGTAAEAEGVEAS